MNEENKQILLENPHADLDTLIKYTGLSRDYLRKQRVKLGLPPLRVSSQNAHRVNEFEKDLKENGFDGDWKHGWLKTESTSIFIKNESGFVTYEDMKEELCAEMRKHAPKYPKIKRSATKDGHLLIIDPADVHLGELAVMEETDNDYNIEIAKKRCVDGVAGIINKSKGFPIEKIILVIGNDILHTDTPFRRTTAGTPQDTDSQWWKAFREAKDLYVKIIESLITIADVEVIFCPSNHDYMGGFMLADTISSWFHKSKNVSFQTDIIHRKYVEYNKNMLCFEHGDGAKERDAKDLMADEQPQMWGRTKFRYCYKHHIHHKKAISYVSGKDYIGLSVEYLRSPSGTDGWHHRNGYVSKKAVEGFIHHPQNGQVARLTHFF